MKKQLHITYAPGEKLVIDLVDNEAVTVSLHHNPYLKKRSLPETYLEVSGNRWVSDGMDTIQWLQRPVLNEQVLVEVKESAEAVSAPESDKRFVEPEPECSFCQKRASEVKVLIAAKLFAHICNECVATCQSVIAEREAT